MDNKALAQVVQNQVAKLTSAVDKLTRKVNELITNKPRQEYVNPDPPQQHTDDDDEPTYFRETSVPPPPADRRKSKPGTDNPKPKRKPRQRVWRFIKRVLFKRDWLERMGIFAGIVYAVVTVMQWRDLRHNFEYTERSWIRVEPAFPNTIPDGSFAMKTMNFGQSAAMGVKVYTWAELLDHSDAPSFKESGFHAVQAVGLYFPGQVVDDQVHIASPTGSGDWVFSESEKADLSQGKLYLVIYGIAVYHDQFGYHWTRFCRWRSYSEVEGIGFNAYTCAFHNTVGDGRFLEENDPRYKK